MAPNAAGRASSPTSHRIGRVQLGDISPQWQIETDPDHTSEVEVVFIAEAPRRTALSWNTATSTGTDPAG